MAMFSETVRSRDLSVFAAIAGMLGLVFFWWVPFGIVLSLTGLILGIVSWVMAPRREGFPGWAVVSILICLATLALNLAVAWNGLEFIQLTAYR
jgi:hypothetical protein